MVEYLNSIHTSLPGPLLMSVMDRGRGSSSPNAEHLLVDWMKAGGIPLGLKEVSILELGLKKERDMTGCGGEGGASNVDCYYNFFS